MRKGPADIDGNGNYVINLLNADGAHVQSVFCLDTFDEGDVVEIDFENCTIKKNGQNWIHYIDRASTFTDMGLGMGSSTFGFEADDGDSHMHVFLYFNKLFLGL